MTYEIVFSKSAAKSLEKIPDPDYSKILRTVLALSTNPHPLGSLKLKGRNGYRIRQGNYRIIYEVIYKTLIVDVIAIGHRKDIYD
jgi:mRNA interferase RelE/StbE